MKSPERAKVIKVVFDTNVIVSGLIASSGSPHEVLEAWHRGDVVLLVCEAIADEVTGVLQRPYFRDKRQITRSDIARIKNSLETDAVVVSPEVTLEVVRDDPDDNRILECALEGGAEYVVSGDHHLLELKRFRGTQIVTAREFLSILELRRFR